MTDTKHMVEIMQAYLDGKPIEYSYTGDIWAQIEEPSWNWTSCAYRVAPDSPDSIDWSHVADDFKWMARDHSGSTYLYVGEPKMEESYGCWIGDGKPTTNASGFKSYRRGTVDWKDSLVERPT